MHLITCTSDHSQGALLAAPSTQGITELLPELQQRPLCSQLLCNTGHTVLTRSRFCLTAAGLVVSQFYLPGARSAVIPQLLNCHWSSSFLQARCLVKTLQQPRNSLRINRENVNTSKVHSSGHVTYLLVLVRMSCFWLWIFPVPASNYRN